MVACTILVRRIRKGVEVDVPIQVEYDPRGHGLPTLRIATDWRKRTDDYATVVGYRVQELEPDRGMPGRAFLLWRAKQDVARDREKTGQKVDRYACLIGRGGEPTRCECRGSAAQDRCKHTDALKHLIQVGVMGPDPWPDEEPVPAGVLAAAREELPF